MKITEKTDNKFLKDTDVLICPAFISIDAVAKIINNSGIKLGAQNLFMKMTAHIPEKFQLQCLFLQAVNM